MSDVLLDLAAERTYRGKVRDTSTWRPHADCRDRPHLGGGCGAANGIPQKAHPHAALGLVVHRIKEVVPNHFIAVLTEQNKELVPFELGPEYYGRSMIVKKAKRLDAECIVSGYISGSAGRTTSARARLRYRAGGGPARIGRLPDRYLLRARRPNGSARRNISYEQLEQAVGEEPANAMKLRSLAVYNYAHTVALERGIIIADTKFEFGVWNEEVILIDEVLTPDSSRFWPADQYRAGGPQPSFDKQPVRDWLAKSGWKDGDPAPSMPGDVVAATTERYRTAYKTLTGEELPE